MVRRSFWKWLMAWSVTLGTFRSPLTLCAICRRKRDAALLGDEAGFGIAGLADDVLETRAVELAVGALEARIAGDALGDVGVGDAEPQFGRLFVERRLRHHLAEHLPVEAERARLIGRDRTADLAADLLQTVGIELAELLDRDFGVADVGDRVLAEAAENIADAPDREADDQEADDDEQDRLCRSSSRRRF